MMVVIIKGTIEWCVKTNEAYKKSTGRSADRDKSRDRPWNDSIPRATRTRIQKAASKRISRILKIIRRFWYWQSFSFGHEGSPSGFNVHAQQREFREGARRKELPWCVLEFSFFLYHFFFVCVVIKVCEIDPDPRAVMWAYGLCTKLTKTIDGEKR